MQVYIEYVVIDNLFINYVLLYVTALLLKVKTSRLKLFLSALLGTAVAVIVPLFTLDNGYMLLIKTCLALLMVLIIGAYPSVKKYLYTVICFVLITFLFGGAVIMLFYLSGTSFEVYFSLNYDSFMPVGISVFIVFVLSKLLTASIKTLLKERDLKPFTRRCAIVVGKKKIITVGFIDSGNRLYGGLTLSPVIVASKELFTRVLSLGAVKGVCDLQVETVSGKTDLKLYSIDKLMIYNGDRVNIFNNVLIACAESGNFSEGFELLLHPSLC
ncbi:MAG: sigma-E processing peptidase SpoIIGA [Clostridia bacterium]|nr:sigma-E processing peptidase SpoIIGA [Clostridia bacterium]